MTINQKTVPGGGASVRGGYHTSVFVRKCPAFTKCIIKSPVFGRLEKIVVNAVENLSRRRLGHFI